MERLLKSLRSKVWAGMVIGLAAASLVLALRVLGTLEFLELKAYDILLQLRSKSYSQEERIVTIGVAEADISRLGHWPITDNELAEILTTICRMQPAVVGLDIYRDLPVGDGAERLRRVFAENKNIVTVFKLGDNASPEVAKPLAAGPDTPVGFADVMIDQDGEVRRGLLFLDDGKTAVSSFALTLAMGYASGRGTQGGSDPVDPSLLKFGAATFIPLEGDDGGYSHADAGGYQYLLDFPAGGRGITHLSLGQIMDKAIPPEVLAGKIVILGSTAESLKDYFFLPVRLDGGESQRAHGIELHALSASQLLRLAFGEAGQIRTPAKWIEAVMILVFALAGAALSVRTRSFYRLAGTVAGLASLAAAAACAAFIRGLWLPLVPVLAAGVGASGLTSAYAYYLERAKRDMLMRLFSANVSKDTAQYIWEHHDKIMEDGRIKPVSLTATVLFTDIKGFTTISESMDPAALMDWLNEYMALMNQVILKHGGMINKYIGDAVMVLFGVPLSRTGTFVCKDAEKAVRCALDMGRVLEELNQKRREQGRPEIKMRVGIHTGELVAGCIGDANRMEYTVIGDTVNVASRLESYDKTYAGDVCCRVLTGETTRLCLGESFLVERVGTQMLKGKESGVEVYHISGEVTKAVENRRGQG